MPPACFLLLRIALAILGHLFLHVKLMTDFSRSVKNEVGILIGIALILYFLADHFWQNGHFENIYSAYPRAGNIFPSSKIVFDFFRQCSIVFIVEVFYLFG